MNAVLINTLLSLISTAFKLLYEQEWMMNPIIVFQQFFDWFVIKYRCTLAKDRDSREINWMAIAANWHPSMGFEVLTLHLFCGVTFASLSGHPIMDKDTIDIGMRALNCTGLFLEEYKTWILRGNKPANQTTSFPSKHFGRMQSKFLHLPPSLQASMDMAWPQPTAMHWHNLSRMRC
jgi:hypothetical protein